MGVNCLLTRAFEAWKHVSGRRLRTAEFGEAHVGVKVLAWRLRGQPHHCFRNTHWMTRQMSAIIAALDQLVAGCLGFAKDRSSVIRAWSVARSSRFGPESRLCRTHRMTVLAPIGHASGASASCKRSSTRPNPHTGLATPMAPLFSAIPRLNACLIRRGKLSLDNH